MQNVIYSVAGDGFVFQQVSSQEQSLGWVERLRNDLFCVEWDVKPQLGLLSSVLPARHSLDGASVQSSFSAMSRGEETQLISPDKWPLHSTVLALIRRITESGA